MVLLVASAQRCSIQNLPRVSPVSGYPALAAVYGCIPRSFQDRKPGGLNGVLWLLALGSAPGTQPISQRQQHR